MTEFDALAPNYRRAQQRWPGASSLGKHYAATARCFSEGGYGVVEHVKSFVESVCVTILIEHSQPLPSTDPSATDLLVAALGPLGLRNTRGASKLDRLLSGFNKLSDALTDIRNAAGPVAHGKDGFLDAISADHARAYLAVGDAILGVLLNALEGKAPDLYATREPYERFHHLNQRIDRAVSVQARVDEEGDRQIVVFSVTTGPREALELRVEPSRILYGLDRDAYIEVLEAASKVLPSASSKEASRKSDTEHREAAKAQWEPAQSGLRAVLTPKYTGALDPYRSGLKKFLTAEGLAPTNTDEAGNRLVDSLLDSAEQNLGVDWTDREQIQARIKISCKRVLVHFGVDNHTEEVAGRFLAWLRIQVGSVGAGDTVPAVKGSAP